MNHIATIKQRRVIDIEASTGDLDGHRVVQGNAGIDYLICKTDPEWRGYPSYSMLFEKDGTANEYEVQLVDGEAACLIPPDMLETTGKLRFALKGLDGEGVTRILTEERNAFLVVVDSGPIDGGEGHEAELTRLEKALQDAEDLTEVTCSVEDITGGHRVTLTDSDGNSNSFDVMDGQRGPEGQTGPVGVDGITPTVTITPITGGHNIAFIYGESDPRNADFDVMDGEDRGIPGEDGEDGITPVVSVTSIEGGHRIAFSYGADDPRNVSFDVLDGEDGAAGQTGRAGTDGYSPIATVTQTSGGATISITDKNGTTSANISNGQPGQAGQAGPSGADGVDGITPTITITRLLGGNNVAFIYGESDPRNTNFDVMDGAAGAAGQDGDDGITPIVTVTQITGGHNVAFSYGSGDSRNTDFDVMDGEDGQGGGSSDVEIIGPASTTDRLSITESQSTATVAIDPDYYTEYSYNPPAYYVHVDLEDEDRIRRSVEFPCTSISNSGRLYLSAYLSVKIGRVNNVPTMTFAYEGAAGSNKSLVVRRITLKEA